MDNAATGTANEVGRALRLRELIMVEVEAKRFRFASVYLRGRNGYCEGCAIGAATYALSNRAITNGDKGVCVTAIVDRGVMTLYETHLLEAGFEKYMPRAGAAVTTNPFYQLGCDLRELAWSRVSL